MGWARCPGLLWIVWNTDRMGRHSAPDDEDEDGDVPLPSAVAVERPTPRGRHARPDTDETPEAAEPDEPDEPDEPATDSSVATFAPRPGKGNQATADDLELLREHSDVRNRVIAALIAPFVIYTLALYLGGGMGVFFIWVWLPLVTAGVLAGSILDAAHRQRARGERSE